MHIHGHSRLASIQINQTDMQKLKNLMTLALSTKVSCVSNAIYVKPTYLRRNDHASLNLEPTESQSILSSESEFSAASNLTEFVENVYHTTEEIHSLLTNLVSSCDGLSMYSKGPDNSKSATDLNSDISIDVFTYKKPGTTPNNRAFLLFGEHARELISSESALHLIQTLCLESDYAMTNRDKIQNTTQNTEFRIIVNGNPSSRRKVEHGDYCLRVNENGVDLNRNWASHWKNDVNSPDTNPGTAPFSEIETRIFKKEVEKYNPKTFITVHSGTKGMYIPFAYNIQMVNNSDTPTTISILKEVDAAHCVCPFGAAGKEVGYECPGTSLDYVYSGLSFVDGEEKKHPFSFAYEIYASPDQESILRRRYEAKISHQLSFIQSLAQKVEVTITDDTSNQECFDIFNPGTTASYRETIKNWTGAYLDTVDAVAKTLSDAD